MFLYLCVLVGALADGLEPLGVVVGPTKGGAQVVSVVGGSVAGFMGFQEGDEIKKFGYFTTRPDKLPPPSDLRTVTKPSDVSELLDGKKGYYLIVITNPKTGPRTIAGKLDQKTENGKIRSFFVRDQLNTKK